MNETSTDKQMTNDFDQLKIRLKTTWMAGDYDRFSRYMANDAERFFRRLGIKPGTRLLDVGCGAGQLALIAGRAGARVTGCDIATNGLEKARARAAAEGLQIAFEEGEDPKGQSVETPRPAVSPAAHGFSSGRYRDRWPRRIISPPSANYAALCACPYVLPAFLCQALVAGPSSLALIALGGGFPYARRRAGGVPYLPA